jgi:hypothetical protein
VPTIGFSCGTFVPGVVAHTWQAAASSGMSIGPKGMVVAAKALAITGADLFADAQLIAEANAEFHRQLNSDTYQSVIPELQKPPLGYRTNSTRRRKDAQRLCRPDTVEGACAETPKNIAVTKIIRHGSLFGTEVRPQRWSVNASGLVVY